MFSLQKFFGKDPQFFELLEASAREAQTGGAALQKLLREPNGPISLTEIRSARLKSKEITEHIGELVVRTFVTALEREDIESLSNALYKILKPMEKFAERFQISQAIVQGFDFSSQASIIERATESVGELVKQVRKAGNLEHVRKLSARLQQSEAEADTLELELLSALYQRYSTEAARIIVIKDLYDLLEKTVDRCRDVGNIVMHIVLKNS